MAITHLGEITLRSTDESNVFYQEQVFETMITDETEAYALENPDAINGFDAQGNDADLVLSSPSTEMMPVHVAEGNDYIRVAYTDAGNSTVNYDVLVYLLIEEEPQ